METIQNLLGYFMGIPFALIATVLLMIFKPFKEKILGLDRGRAFVIGSEANKNKPTGVGIYFITVFIICALAYGHLSIGWILFLIVMAGCCLCGYLDDVSRTPWNEYIKGGLDFVIAIFTAIIVVLQWNSDMFLPTGSWVGINPFLYIFLAIILVIVSINATNATDGVDGLSGTLSIITILTLIIAAFIRGTLNLNSALIGFLMIAVLIGYLIFNFHPSKVLMGDAGSRAIGLFIAFYAMFLDLPFAYLVVGLPFMLDGGLSVLKITIGRLSTKLLKKKILILPNTVTPIHDHLKQVKGFSIKKTYFTICAFALIVDCCYLGFLMIIKLASMFF